MAFACFTTRDSHVMYDSRKYSTWVGCVLIAHVAVAVDVGREHAPVCIKVLFTAARVFEKRLQTIKLVDKSMAHISPFCFLFSLRRERGRVV